MPAITDVEGLPVIDADGREVAAIHYVLFHPTEPRVVAAQLVLPSVLGLVPRKPRFIPLTPEMLEPCGESRSIRWPRKKLPSRAGVEKEIGVPLDSTVIWRNMEVVLEGGTKVGSVADVVFSRKSGKVLRILLSEGSLADFAVGRREIPGELIEGFNGTAVVIDKSFKEAAPSSGGLAAASGKGAAYAKMGAEKAADAVTAAGVAGLGALERSFRSGLGRDAVRGLKRAGKRVRKVIDGDEG